MGRPICQLGSFGIRILSGNDFRIRLRQPRGRPIPMELQAAGDHVLAIFRFAHACASERLVHGFHGIQRDA